MKYEEDVLTKITLARTKFLDAQSVKEKAESDNMIADALKSLFAVSENYPELRSSENFQQLQSRISGLENELSDRREFYNDSVNEYNIKIKSLPDLIIARILGYTTPYDMFEVDEEDKKDVEINFDK
jgi:LemA protein